jgi:triosephosphate isomerase
MTRRKLIAGNWKMNLTSTAGMSLAQAVNEAAARRPEVDVVVCPSFTSLHAVKGALSGGRVMLGAQDVFWEENGAFTGEISPDMLVDSGCQYCIVGHSERRGRFGKSEMNPELLCYFSDSDAAIAKKLECLVFHAITPILCVGETQAERDSGQTEAVIRQQLRAALQGLASEECSGLAVAYEPVWAIGTGNVCSEAEADRVGAFIRSELVDLSDPECAGKVRLLYGGSVKPDNAAGLLSQPNIDGALVGGASLDPDAFSRIIFAA